MPDLHAVIAAAIKIAVAVGFIMLTVPMLVWLERKLIADFQARVGPQRVGPFGLLQSFADGIKLVLKESIIPNGVDKFLYLAAPVTVMLPALGVAAVIPFGGPVDVLGHRHQLVIADLSVGLLFVLALTSLSVYGIVLAGWASNNKYSLLGGLRSAAQMVSYELPMGLSVVAGLMICSYAMNENLMSLSLSRVVEAQAGGLFNWTAFNPRFLFLGMLAMITFFIGGIAETNRAPFDLPEAESELIGGYHTEYGGLKWAMFFLGEYAAMLNVASMTVVLFLGGYLPPYPQFLPIGSVPAAIEGITWFGIKIFLIQCFYMWMRATLPRIRYDQLMGFTWKLMLPTTLLNVLLIGTMLTIFHPLPPPAVLLPPVAADPHGAAPQRERRRPPLGLPPPAPGEMPLGLPGGPTGAPPGIPEHQEQGGLVEPSNPAPSVAPAAPSLTPAPAPSPAPTAPSAPAEGH